jgi:acylphosphatase
VISCRRFLISGRVQGVFFRAGTQAEARRLGLAGHASNRPDGSVEVVARGERDAVEELAVWLRHGPSRARVDSVAQESIDCEALDGFTIR